MRELYLFGVLMVFVAGVSLFAGISLAEPAPPSHAFAPTQSVASRSHVPLSGYETSQDRQQMRRAL